MSSNKWFCYLLYSLETNSTYIGSTNDPEKRLHTHNSGRGAKYTMGETWCPYLIIHGFENKIMCLSFESQWKKLSKKRSNVRFDAINKINKINISYTKITPLKARILDLIYMMYHLTINDKRKISIDKQMKLNFDIIPFAYQLFIHSNDEFLNISLPPWFVSYDQDFNEKNDAQSDESNDEVK
jgi:putative endonuclease